MGLVYDEAQLRDISTRFHIYGQLLHAEPCKIGHINETYTATMSRGQRSALRPSKDQWQGLHQAPGGDGQCRSGDATYPPKLVAAEETDITRKVLILIPSRDGKCFYQDDEGHYWPIVYVENIRTYESVESTRQALEAGKAFGLFVQQLSDSPRCMKRLSTFTMCANASTPCKGTGEGPHQSSQAYPAGNPIFPEA